MATTTSRIVPGEDSDIHDEPHLAGRRITVQAIHAQVHERGLEPEAVAERYELDLADVYRALTYYYDHPAEMAAVERRRERAIEEHAHRTTDPESVRD